MRDAVSCSVVTLLLGNNKRSRRLARRLFLSFGLRSSVFDHQSSRALDLMISARFVPIPKTESDDFALLSLERFACGQEDFTCLIIPCSEEYDGLIKRNRRALESRFIIRSYDEMMSALRNRAKLPYAKV